MRSTWIRSFALLAALALAAAWTAAVPVAADAPKTTSEGGRPRLPARARPGRRGPARLPRRLGLRPGLLRVGHPGPGRDRRAPGAAEAAARPGVLPGRQHLLARQRRPLQDALRRRLRPAHPRLQGPRGPRQPRPQGLPGRRGVRAVGVVPEELRSSLVGDRKARYIRQGLDEAQAAEKAEADTQGGNRRRAGGRGDQDAARQLPSRRRDGLRERDQGDAGLLRGGGALAHAVRLRQRGEGRPALAAAAALLQHPVAAAAADAGGGVRTARRPPDAAAGRRDGARLEHAGSRRRRPAARAGRTSCSCSGCATPCRSGCPRRASRTASGRSWRCTTPRTRHRPAPAGCSASASAATATHWDCASSSTTRSRTWSRPTWCSPATTTSTPAATRSTAPASPRRAAREACAIS